MEDLYSGDGQRIKQNDDGYVTKYYYDDESFIFTTDENNSKETENILDPSGVIVASKRFDGIYNNMYFFYNYDIRGSVTNIINPDGQIVKGYDYDEFGGTKEKGDYAFKNDVKFTGAVHDKSANLYYMNARFYNPNTGRFITEDTYSGNAYEPWTQHLYTYTSNNPVNFIDPTGHRAMYAMDPEDETDVQRSTSLNQMKGYSAKDSYKIATAKTKKKKQKAIKTAQENKEIRVAKEQDSRFDKAVNFINNSAIMTSAIAIGDTLAQNKIDGISLVKKIMCYGSKNNFGVGFEMEGSVTRGWLPVAKYVAAAGVFSLAQLGINAYYNYSNYGRDEARGRTAIDALGILAGVGAGVAIGLLVAPLAAPVALGVSVVLGVGTSYTINSGTDYLKTRIYGKRE